MRQRVIVIGAGHNGLTTAAYLARRGHQVLALEARDQIGGIAARDKIHEGYHVPGLLHETTGLRLRVVQDLGLERHGLRWREEPLDICAPQTDGEPIWIRNALSPQAHVEGALSESDVQAFADLNALLRRLRPLASRILNNPAPDPLGSPWPLLLDGLALRKLGGADMTELLRLGPMCVGDWLRNQIGSERLRAALALPALEGQFAGPWSASTAANLLLRIAGDGREVRGGPAALVDALSAAATSLGVEIRTGCKVQRILTKAGRVRAVQLESGEEIACYIVAASCDPRHTFLNLVGEQFLPPQLASDMRNLRGRGTLAKVHLALSGPLEVRGAGAVEALRTGDTLDALEQAFDAIKYRGFSQKPALDIRVPSMSTPDLCPPGHHVVSILVYFAPYDLEGGWNDRQRQALGDTVIRTLAEHCPSVKERLIASEVLTPLDLELRYGLVSGHVHHGEHAPDQLLFMRPTIQCARYKTPVPGLFLCGSGSHPGGGITCMPGALAFDELEACLHHQPAEVPA